MKQLELQEKHDKIAESDFFLKQLIGEMRSLSEQEIRTRESKASNAYSKFRRDDCIWTSKASIINILSILAYPLAIAVLGELLVYGHYKNETAIALSALSIGYCIFHYKWAKRRKYEKEYLLKEMRAANAVLIEKGDVVATKMQNIGLDDI